MLINQKEYFKNSVNTNMFDWFYVNGLRNHKIQTTCVPFQKFYFPNANER